MRRYKLYFVGYDNDDNDIHGNYRSYAEPLTLTQAKREVTMFPEKGAVIYKLVKVKSKEVKK